MRRKRWEKVTNQIKYGILFLSDVRARHENGRRPMNDSLYVLGEDPFEGFFPQDLFSWLEQGVSDAQLAKAYAVVSDHCSALMFILGDDDPWGDQALDDWWEVENRIVSMITDRQGKDGMLPPGNMGMHCLVAPFMERQGYEDCGGFWRMRRA